MSGRAARLVAPFVSILLGLAVGEAFLRWGGFGGGATELHARLLQHDSRLGWRKTPGASVSYRWNGRRITETVDAGGARGGGSHSSRDADLPRVLLLGDSFCEGFLVNDDEVISAVLERLRPVEAINHGVVGYSTDQQLLLFREVRERVRPDYVVILLFDNDVWFNGRDQEHRAKKPFAYLDGDRLAFGGIPVPRRDLNPRASPAADRAAPLRIVRLLRDVWTRPGPRPAAGRLEPNNELLLYRVEPVRTVEEGWELTEVLLRRFSAEVRAVGARPMVLYVPNVAAVSDESLAATRELYGMAETAWDFRRVESRLRDVCDRIGMPLVTPTEALRRAAAAGATPYYLNDGHWTPAGHRLAARELAANLHLD